MTTEVILYNTIMMEERQNTDADASEDADSELYQQWPQLGEERYSVLRKNSRGAVRKLDTRVLRQDPVMQPAAYNCGHRGCGQRMLIGIKNYAHINHAIATIESFGWRFHKSSGAFFCKHHRHKIQQLDVLRDQYGHPLPIPIPIPTRC